MCRPYSPPRRGAEGIVNRLADALSSLVATRRRAWGVLLVAAALTAGAGSLVRGLVQDDDLLAFLPERSAEVRDFRVVADRYGSIDVALLGIEAPPGPLGVFAPAFIEALVQVNRDLKNTGMLAHIISLTNAGDVVADPAGGAITANLVPEIPADDAAALALRERVLARDAVVGNLVSADGGAVVILPAGFRPGRCLARPTGSTRKGRPAARRRCGKMFSEHLPNA